MKKFNWMYFFIYLGLAGCVLTIIGNILLNKDIFWQVGMMGWIGATYFLQRRIDEYETKN